MIDLSTFEILSFDCYGTLIDWETGIVQSLRPILRSHGVELTDDQVLGAFAAHESVAQALPYSTYREVLAEVVERIGEQYDFRPTTDDLLAFSTSVRDWPAFPDAAVALATLKQRYRLAVITNCDDDLFAESNKKLGVDFDWIVTAEQARVYKPDLRPFHMTIKRIGGDASRLLHVAQSMFHDHEPAKRMGLTTVWINRRHKKPGLGATPPADATPDLELPDLQSLADMTEPVNG
jgi:2-haloacid dehalogenase